MLVIATREEALGNAETGRTSEKGKNGKNKDSKTNFVQVPYI